MLRPFEYLLKCTDCETCQFFVISHIVTFDFECLPNMKQGNCTSYTPSVRDPNVVKIQFLLSNGTHQRRGHSKQENRMP